MKKKLILLLALSFLTACSALDFASKFIPTNKSGIEVDAQVGDKDQSVDVGTTNSVGDIVAKDKAVVNVENKESSAQVEQADQVVVNNQIPPWILILLVAGWVLPTPNQCLGYFKRDKKEDSVNVE